MQPADMSQGLAVPQYGGALTGVHRRMRRRLGPGAGAVAGERDDGFQIGLEIEEIRRSLLRAPLFGQHRAAGHGRQTPRLKHGAFFAAETNADLEQPHSLVLTAHVARHGLQQAGQQ